MGGEGHPGLAPGPPQGRRTRSCRSSRSAARLAELLGDEHEVLLADDCVGDGVQKLVKDLKDGQVLLLENLRFHKEEEANDEAFARELAALRRRLRQRRLRHRAPRARLDRGHGAVREGEGRRLPDGARSSSTWASVLKNPEKPFVAILGGAKVSRQDQGDREPAAQGGRAAHRRRHGLHLPQGAGRRGRQEPGRGGQARRWPRKLLDAAQRLRTSAGAAGRPRRAAPSPTRRASATETPERAIPDGPDGPGHRPEDARRCTPQHIRGAQDRALERADGPVRGGEVRRRHHARWPRRWPSNRQAHDGGRRRRQRGGGATRWASRPR